MPLLALSVWPIISMVLFARLGPMKGAIWAALLGAMFLPEAYSIDLPLLPAFNKDTTIVLGLLLGLMVTYNPQRAPARPDRSSGDPLAWTIICGLAGLLLLSSLVTMLANGETLRFGPKILPGLGIKDFLEMSVDACVFLVPFGIALRYMADPRAHSVLLGTVVILGGGYALLALFEWRMSPQLHTWVYGYFQHSWIQHIRGGHFRPIVFMEHALWVGMFLATCCLAAFILVKEHLSLGDKKGPWILAGFGFLSVLIMCRTSGALMVALIFIPVVWFLSPRLQLILSTAVAVIFLAFPMLRQTEIVTFQGTISMIERISADRASSRAFRVAQDDAFLARAVLKPVTGWGRWARARIHDPETGIDISTNDGAWIIVLGELGWLGYISFFGLITAPILLTWRQRKTPLPPQTSGLALIIAATLIYQIPNDTLGVMIALFSGALAGYVIRPVTETADQTALPPEAAGPRTLSYTRFPEGKLPPVPDPEPKPTRKPAQLPTYRRARAEQPRNMLLTPSKRPAR